MNKIEINKAFMNKKTKQKYVFYSLITFVFSISFDYPDLALGLSFLP